MITGNQRRLLLMGEGDQVIVVGVRTPQGRWALGILHQLTLIEEEANSGRDVVEVEVTSELVPPQHGFQLIEEQSRN